MARMARVVLPDVPHHITQRGNRCQPTFFEDGDYELYRELLADSGERHGVAIWAYCLMPNHVHLVAVPGTPEALSKGLGEAHQRFTQEVNARAGWTGHLWQGRFFSAPLDEAYLYHASRYVELNPVRAGLAPAPADYRWSSAAAHLAGEDDGLVAVAPVLERWPDWGAVLAEAVADETIAVLRERTRTGRLAGSEEFVRRAETVVGRRLRRLSPGRKQQQ